MSTDVGNGAQTAALFSQDAPVVIRLIEQPILHITADDRMHFTQPVLLHHLARLHDQRVVAQIIIHAGSEFAFLGQIHQRCGLARVHGQWFFAQHMFAGLEGVARHLKVQPVGCSYMNGMDVFIFKHFGIA